MAEALTGSTCRPGRVHVDQAALEAGLAQAAYPVTRRGTQSADAAVSEDFGPGPW